jgi:ribosomal protein L31
MSALVSFTVEKLTNMWQRKTTGVWVGQDPTCHPAWTGETKVEVKDDSHAARFMRKFGMTEEDLNPGSTPGKK